MSNDFEPLPNPELNQSAPVPGYAAWLEDAKKRLEKLNAERWEHRRELCRLNDEIHDLLHVMGNGAAGGTAWTLHNDALSGVERKP